MTKAVVLAAGLGSRLGPRTRHAPKSLLRIEGETILGRLLRQCQAAGMGEAVIVTGHAASSVKTFAESAPLPVRLVYNPDYATINNALSLLVAKGAIDGATIVKFDGDLVMDDAILPRLLASPERSCIVLDEERALTDEDMKAQVDGDSGHVTAFGKHLPMDADGISIGVERIDAADLDIVFDAIDRRVHERGDTDAYYEDAYDDALARGLTLGHVTTGGRPWQEVDTAADLEAAHRMLRSTKRVAR